MQFSSQLVFFLHLPTKQVMRGVLFLAVSIACMGCNLPYYLENGTKQAELLLGRRYIRDILNSSERTPEEEQKLRLILDARNFAKAQGFSVRGSYNTYRELPSDNLTWVVMGTPPDSFTPYRWKFPIVGEVPYKGYFAEDDAHKEAARIETEGYESFVRSSDALSTLGWFDDPVLSSMLKKEPHQITDVLFHELFHATVWIPEHVDFNESVATFIGAVTNLQFFQNGDIAISKLPQEMKDEYQIKAKKSLSGMYWLSDGIGRLYSALDTLYKRDIPRDQKIEQRGAIYKTYKERYFPEVPEALLPAQVNNSAVLQVKIYYTRMADIQKLFKACDRNIKRFIAATQSIKNKISKDESLSPFDLAASEECQ